MRSGTSLSWIQALQELPALVERKTTWTRPGSGASGENFSLTRAAEVYNATTGTI